MTKPGMASVGSLTDFEKAVKGLNLPPYPHINLFRGQGQDHPLLPGLFRLYRNNVEAIHAKEQELLVKLKHRIPPNTPLRPDNDWDWLSFGQHYRLPTRLLDWSQSSLVALYFAVEGSPVSPTVYVYPAPRGQIMTEAGGKKRESPFHQTNTRIMTPSVHSVRVKLQHGWHTVHHLHPRKSGGRIVIPLLDMQWYRDRLNMIRIERSAAETIKKDLAKKGIYHSTVYGDFDRICGTIRRDCGL